MFTFTKNFSMLFKGQNCAIIALLLLLSTNELLSAADDENTITLPGTTKNRDIHKC